MKKKLLTGIVAMAMSILQVTSVFAATDSLSRYLGYEDINTSGSFYEGNIIWRDKDPYVNITAEVFEKLTDKKGEDFYIKVTGKDAILDIPANVPEITKDLKKIFKGGIYSEEDIYYRFSVNPTKNYQAVKSEFKKKFPMAQPIEVISRLKIDIYHDKSETILASNIKLTEAIDYYITLPQSHKGKSNSDYRLYAYDNGNFKHTDYKIINIDGNTFAHLKATEGDIFVLAKNEVEFSDVDKSDKNYRFIKELSERGYFEMAGDLFSPDRPISRGELIDLLAKAFYAYDDSDSDISYYDVSRGSKFYDSIKKLQAGGVLGLWRENWLYPLDPVTNEEMVYVIGQVIESKMNFADLGNVNLYKMYKDYEDISPEYTDALQTVTKLDVISPNESGKLNPKAAATRGDLYGAVGRLVEYSK